LGVSSRTQITFTTPFILKISFLFVFCDAGSSPIPDPDRPVSLNPPQGDLLSGCALVGQYQVAILPIIAPMTDVPLTPASLEVWIVDDNPRLPFPLDILESDLHCLFE
jgi:hypothetical protein